MSEFLKTVEESREAIVKARMRWGSLDALAKRLRVSQDYLRSAERQGCPLYLARRICKVTGASLWWFVRLYAASSDRKRKANRNANSRRRRANVAGKHSAAV